MDNLDWEWFKEEGVWILITVAVAAALVFALRRWGLRWITRLINRITPSGEDWTRGIRISRRIVFWLGSLVIIAVAVLVILAISGVKTDEISNAFGDAGLAIGRWLRDHAVRIAVIVAVAFALQQIARGMIPRIVRSAVVRSEKKRRLIEEAEQRAETLSGFLVGVAVTIVWVVAVFLVLPEFNVNLGPLLAGVGVVGLAIGFGAQGLVRDILAGLFVILEDQYAKGDWVELAGIQGEVEHLGLRRTVLRDFDGIYHTIPNGEVKIASNFTKDWACVNLDVSVGYGEDLDHVAEVINEVSEEMASDDHWRRLILETPQVLRVNNFGDSGIDLKVWGKTKPMMQWGVTGELRRRLKRRFDEEGIEIPWPHIKLYFGDASAKVPAALDTRPAGSTDKPRRRRKKKKDLLDIKGAGDADGSGGGDGG